MTEISASDKIAIARIELLTNHPFYGQLVLMLQPTPSKQIAIGPMATDGKHLFYSKEWLAKFTPDEVKAMLCHEVLHLAFGHPRGHRYNRTGDRDPLKWNIAADIVVNAILQGDSHLTLPSSALTADKIPFDPPLAKPVSECTVEEIYAHLPEQGEQPECGLMDPCTGEGNGKEEGKAPWPMSEVEQQLWQAKAQAAYETAKRAGNAPGSLETIFESLNKPKVNWREQLAQFVQRVFEDFSWIPPDRRSYALSEIVGEEIIMPSLSEGDEIRDVVLAVDSSGSVNDDELHDFVSEVYAIAQIGVNIHLLYCDAAIQGWHELTPNPPPMPRGRGGTSFKPVFKAIAEKPDIRCEALVYFTDGYPNDDWPDPPPFPTMWLVNNNDVDPPWGSVIRYQPSGGE